MFTSIFDNIACVRGTTFGGSLLESLIDVIEQNYWLRRSVFALSSYTNSPDDPLYKGGIVARGVAGSKTMCNQRTSTRGLGDA
jgi:hypothetical protein